MKVGIASGRPEAADVLRRTVMQTSWHHVTWTATTGTEVVEHCLRDPPDLVLMDLHLSDTDAIEATRQITERTPCNVVIVTDSIAANAARVFDAMGRGAIDAVELPNTDHDLARTTEPLLAKIATIARLLGEKAGRPQPRPQPPTPGATARTLVAIGASAGGPPALAALLGALPADFPAAIIVVQHMDAQFAQGMAAWLGAQTKLPVRVAAPGDRVLAGTVLIAGRDEHLVFTSRDRLGYVRAPQPAIYRPSIDVFFQSVLKHWRGTTMGVVLTGMGRDGAAGLKAMRDRGIHTIAQDETSSAVYGMPKAAAALDAAVEILPIERMAARLVQAIGPGPEALGLPASRS